MSEEIWENTKLKAYGRETVLQFIQTTIKHSNHIKTDILDKIKYVSDEVDDGNIKEDRSSQGFYYERLWDLCIKFGVTDLTLPAVEKQLQTYHIINENSNKTAIQFQRNCWDGNKLYKQPDGGYLLKSVRSGNSDGYSDITFLNKNIHNNTEDLYFISVKYFAQEKEISKYDIGKLCSLIREHEKEHRNIHLYIFVKDKKKAIEKFNSQHISSNILIKYINPNGNYEHIYDTNDLQHFYFKLKKLLEQYNYLQTSENILDFQKNYLNVLKQLFIPRFHQQLFIFKINALIEDGEKNILVGAIPRSGKSFIMAGTILEYVKRSETLHPGKKLKFLMMTPAPNETFGEYESIFNNYIDFEKFGIDVITYNGAVSSKKVFHSDKHSVVIISKQKLGWSSSNNEDIVDEDTKDMKTITSRINTLFGKHPDIDVMFLDEAHFGMSTTKAKQIVDILNSTITQTVKIYVTATYNKPLHVYGIPAKCKMTWDMHDIKIMQNLDETSMTHNDIKSQFGSHIYNAALEYYGDKSGQSLVEKLKKEYAIYPKPYLITSLWDKEFLNVEKLKIGNTEFGWDMNKLFATIGESDTFANEEQLKEMMRYYFGYPNKNDTYDKQSFYRARGILPRIRNICVNTCRTLQPQHKTTQLWFLPLGSGKITHKIKALIHLLTASNEFKDVYKHYHFYVALDIEDSSKTGRTIHGVTYMNHPHTIKTEIESIEKDMKDGKIKADNLILLAGQRLQLGISLRNVDIVTLWNSTESADAIFQMLFRSMTEVETPSCAPNEYCNQKKYGFMVDMNPQRAFTNVSLFSENMTTKAEEGDIQKYRQITDLINIDDDVLHDKYGDTEAQKDKFVSELFNKLYASWNINVDNIKKVIQTFSFDMEKLQALKGAFEKIHLDKKRQADEIEKTDNMIESGKKKEKIASSKQKKEKPRPEINLNDVACELITEFISLLNIFTLYNDKGSKCILTDASKINAQITVVDDIDVLKTEIYKDDEQKTMFLKILNGRLSGNTDDPYPEKVIAEVLDALNHSGDKQVMNKIIISQKTQYYTIHEPDKLLEFNNGELKPKAKEKKEHGEVFTPIALVNTMLDRLDDAYIKAHGKSIFSEMNLKWLDPAVGIGNFPIIVYQRLMIGLATQIKDEKARRRHILEHMLYASELTPKNVFIYKKIFCGDTYDLNIHEGDSLEMNVLEAFHLPNDFKGFDVVIGNPPYQGSGRKKAYIEFIHHILLHQLKPDGYMLFITPKLSLLYLLGSATAQRTLSHMHNILYINTSDSIKSNYFKNIGSDFMYFILQNNNHYDTTIVVFDDDTVEPHLKLSFQSILDTTTKSNNNVIINKLIKINSNAWNRRAARIHDNLQDTKSATHVNKIISKIKTNPEDDEISWANKTHSDMNKFKVLYPTLGKRILIDKDKNLFPGTSFVVYVTCESLNECENIKKLMNSKLFAYLENIFRTQRSPRDYVMRNLIKPSSFDITIDSDEDIYRYFQLTKQEIREIENFSPSMQHDVHSAQTNSIDSMPEAEQDDSLSSEENRKKTPNALNRGGKSKKNTRKKSKMYNRITKRMHE
jgi:hypothetical protein